VHMADNIMQVVLLHPLSNCTHITPTTCSHMVHAHEAAISLTSATSCLLVWCMLPTNHSLQAQAERPCSGAAHTAGMRQLPKQAVKPHPLQWTLHGVHSADTQGAMADTFIMPTPM
jgi:hypothetical protein